MPKRKCKNPHRLDGPIMEQVIETAIVSFGWKKAKVLSWYNKENPRLKKSWPSELVDRGQGELVLEFLALKYEERLINEFRAMRKKEK